MPQVTQHPDIAFSAAEIVSAGRSLSAALVRFVFRAAEVEPLRHAAQIYAKKRKINFDSGVGLLERPCADCFEMFSLRSFLPASWDHDPPTAQERRIERLYFNPGRLGKASPISRFEDAVRQRAAALIGMLQANRIIGWGHTAGGSLSLISNSIWSNPSFYIRLETGDVIHVDDEENVTVRWGGVILLLPGQRPETAVHESHSFVSRSESKHVRGPDKAPSKAIVLESIRERAYAQCYRELLDVMSASRDKKTHTKGQLWRSARAKWPDLSHDRFDDAWRQAARDAKAPKWRTAGALKRNPPVD